MAFELFDDGNNTVMAANAQVIALGDIVGENNSRPLADSRKNCEQNSAF
jgi:hypothetical protein